MITWALTAVAWIFVALIEWAGFALPKNWQIVTEPYFKMAVWAVAILLALRAVFWLPFKRNEKQEEQIRKQEEQIRILKQSKAQMAMIDRVLVLYFSEIDTSIDLIRAFRREGAIEKGGETFLKCGELCIEIQKFIEESVGEIEAAIFCANNDNIENIKNAKTADFWEMAIEFMTDKMLKLKEIMRKQANP